LWSRPSEYVSRALARLLPKSSANFSKSATLYRTHQRPCCRSRRARVRSGALRRIVEMVWPARCGSQWKRRSQRAPRFRAGKWVAVFAPEMVRTRALNEKNIEFPPSLALTSASRASRTAFGARLSRRRFRAGDSAHPGAQEDNVKFPRRWPPRPRPCAASVVNGTPGPPGARSAAADAHECDAYPRAGTVLRPAKVFYDEEELNRLIQFERERTPDATYPMRPSWRCMTPPLKDGSETTAEMYASQSEVIRWLLGELPIAT